VSYQVIVSILILVVEDLILDKKERKILFFGINLRIIENSVSYNVTYCSEAV